MRIRTIPEAARELKEDDPATAISEWMIRRLVKQGELPSVAVGRKRLVDLDVLEQYMSDNCVAVPPMRKEVIG